MPVEPNPYDRPDLLDIHKDQDNPCLYLIVRKSSSMSPGKLGTQIGHAVMMLMGRYEALRRGPPPEASYENTADWRAKVDITRQWLQTSYRKVVLVADDKEWEKIKEQLWCFVVKDAGLTEVASGTETILALWPMKKSERPPLIKRLQAL